MGDKARFPVFADFLVGTFEGVSRVADVAGGGGYLSIELSRRGLISTVVDPRRTGLPRRVKKGFHKIARAGGFAGTFNRIEEPIESVELASYDLLVGMHPDGATESIVRAAVLHQKPFAVVPCCVFASDGMHRSFDEWLVFLVSLAPGSRIVSLPFGGPNQVVYCRQEWMATDRGASIPLAPPQSDLHGPDDGSDLAKGQHEDEAPG